jgi:hypothetical protein
MNADKAAGGCNDIGTPHQTTATTSMTTTSQPTRRRDFCTGMCAGVPVGALCMCILMGCMGHAPRVFTSQETPRETSRHVSTIGGTDPRGTKALWSIRDAHGVLATTLTHLTTDTHETTPWDTTETHDDTLNSTTTRHTWETENTTTHHA